MRAVEELDHPLAAELGPRAGAYRLEQVPPQVDGQLGAAGGVLLGMHAVCVLAALACTNVRAGR